MVTSVGHVAFALLFALPAWVRWDGRTSLSFIAFVVAASTLPDLDLVLQRAGFAVKHHGPTHTVVFVVGVAVLGGLLAIVAVQPTLRRWWYETEDEVVGRETIYLFTAGGLALGGLSHLVGDILGGDRYEAIEPLWPVVQEPVALDVLHYTSPWLNVWLLVAAVVLHLAFAATSALPLERGDRSV